MVWKLDSSRHKPGRVEETVEGGRGPTWAVVLLERERERETEKERERGREREREREKGRERERE